MTLVVIDKEKHIHKLCTFDLMLLDDRILLFLAIRYVAFLIPLMYNKLELQTQQLPDFTTLVREHYNYEPLITLDGNQVKKEWRGLRASDIFKVRCF